MSKLFKLDRPAHFGYWYCPTPDVEKRIDFLGCCSPLNPGPGFKTREISGDTDRRFHIPIDNAHLRLMDKAIRETVYPQPEWRDLSPRTGYSLTSCGVVSLDGKTVSSEPIVYLPTDHRDTPRRLELLAMALLDAAEECRRRQGEDVGL